jgi:hypothetical protein
MVITICVLQVNDANARVTIREEQDGKDGMVRMREKSRKLRRFGSVSLFSPVVY